MKARAVLQPTDITAEEAVDNVYSQVKRQSLLMQIPSPRLPDGATATTNFRTRL